MPLPYAASVVLPAGSVAYDTYEDVVTTWNGYTDGFVADPVWSQGNGSYFVSITGTYYAATGGFDATDAGYDDVRNGFYFSGTGHWTYGTTRITYTFGIPSNDISAQALVDPNQPYAVSTTTNDPLLISPVTWSWYVNGQLAGTTSAPQFTVNSGDPSTQQQIQVVGSDGNGHSVSGQTTVNVNAGCGTQLIC